MSRYTVFVWGLLKPLGMWGAFGIAAVDAAFLGMPLDPVIAGYVYNDRSRFLVYALMASVGSAIDDILLVAEYMPEEEIRGQVVVYLPFRG